MSDKIKNCWFVKCSLNYCGCDSVYLAFDMSREDAERDAYEEARQNAESYSNVWWDCMSEEVEEEFGEGSDEYNEAYEQEQEENSQYYVEEFDIEKHEGELMQDEIETYNTWKNGSN